MAHLQSSAVRGQLTPSQRASVNCFQNAIFRKVPPLKSQFFALSPFAKCTRGLIACCITNWRLRSGACCGCAVIVWDRIFRETSAMQWRTTGKAKKQTREKSSEAVPDPALPKDVDRRRESDVNMQPIEVVRLVFTWCSSEFSCRLFYYEMCYLEADVSAAVQRRGRPRR